MALRGAEAQKLWKLQHRPQPALTVVARRKYGNVPVTTEEGTFDSQTEYERWCALKLEQRAGLISGLQHHVVFKLIVDGTWVADYEADYVYFRDNKRVVEDRKGVKTKEFLLKARLMLAIYKIEVLCT